MTLQISSDSLDWALSHAKNFGDTDIFPRPVEFEALNSEWSTVKPFLCSQNVEEWIARVKRECMSPKGRFSYRVSTQLDPLDSLLFLALTYEIGEDLEDNRIPVDREVVFSHRFLPDSDGQMYDPDLGWSSFARVSKERAKANSTKYVVITDISDFFQRIYHHRIENALDSATTGAPHARVLSRLISQWRGGPSFGIPIGPAPSRIVAEVILDDVDNLLLASGAKFCRYSDDYRLFCRTKKEAYERLAFLANVLHQNHGLALQPGKTKILSDEEFLEFATRSPESQELQNLEDKFEELVKKLNLEDPYAAIDYDDLDEEQQALIDGLNLRDILDDELAKDEVDIGVMRFLLRRFAQLDAHDVAPKLLTMPKIEKCYSVLPSVMEYVQRLSNIPPVRKRKVGEALIRLLGRSSVAHLPFHRSWLLSPFAARNGWGQESELGEIYDHNTDLFTRREVILAMGRAGQDYWFRTQLNEAMNMEPWTRRAFLLGANCLPRDERKHWYRGQKMRLDVLEQACVDWVQKNPFPNT